MVSQFTELKLAAQKAVERYYDLLDTHSGDGGAHIAAIINPAIGLAAQEANRLCLLLKKVDPDFPIRWVPYHTGNE